MDDYGGPYREVFQLICDELQSPDPSSSLPSSSTTNGNAWNDNASVVDSSKDMRGREGVAMTPSMTPLRHDLLSTPKTSEHPSTPSSHRDNNSTVLTTPASNSNRIGSSLSSPPPHTTGTLPVVTESEGGVGSGTIREDLNKRAVRCFLPLLHPTPNWSLTSTSTDCTERYRYVIYHTLLL